MNSLGGCAGVNHMRIIESDLPLQSKFPYARNGMLFLLARHIYIYICQQRFWQPRHMANSASLDL